MALTNKPTPFIKRIDELISMLDKICANLSCATIFLMTLMISANVFMRFIFNRPSEFVEEYSGFMFVMIVFMGLGYVARMDMHISVELFYFCFEHSNLLCLWQILLSTPLPFPFSPIWLKTRSTVSIQGHRIRSLLHTE